jgi:hypothetical protein
VPVNWRNGKLTHIDCTLNVYLVDEVDRIILPARWEQSGFIGTLQLHP